MTKETIQDFTLRISQANTGGLVVILYDIILAYLKDALNAYEAGQMDDYVVNMKRAQKSHQELMKTLNMKESVADDIMTLYVFVNKKLIDAAIKRQPENIDVCIEILEKLKIGFVEVAKQDKEPPIMQNAHQVYSGLTYGKGNLNESLDLDGQMSRGFRV